MNEENGKSAELPAPPPDGRRYAGFWIRAVASIIDDCIVMAASLVLTVAGLYVIYQLTKPAPKFTEAFTGGFIQTVNFAAMTFISIPYYIGFHWRFGWTPGKRIFRIRVIREIDDGSLSFGRSSARYFAQILSALPFGAGYLMAAFNRKKQALHDAIAGTVSVFEKD
jgi:uncharacterized RDD family membrane protein YckC